MSNRLEMIKDLIVEFDDMGYEPSLTLCPDRVEEINDFRRRLKNILHISQEQEKVLEILFSKKYIPLDKLNPKWWASKEVYDECVNYEMYLLWCKDYEVVLKPEQILTQEEFNTLKEYFKYE